MVEEHKHDSDIVRKILDDYVNNEYEIDGERDRLRYLISKKTNISAKSMDGMPRSSNSSTDRMADALGKEEELREKIQKMIDSQAVKRKEIEAIIRKLKNPEERQVVRLRYFDRAKWEEIIEVMYGLREDFDDRYDTYKRRMFGRHSSALTNMENYIVAEPNTEIPAI